MPTADKHVILSERALLSVVPSTFSFLVYLLIAPSLVANVSQAGLQKWWTVVLTAFTMVCQFRVPSKITSTGQVCSCMGDLTASVHPSVCPETGRLRVTWVSQGRQVRLLSCSFSGSWSCAMPMVFLPFAFQQKLITRVLTRVTVNTQVVGLYIRLL